MSVVSSQRRQRVRLYEATQKTKKRVRLYDNPEEALIADFMDTQGLTRCPPAAVETVRGLYPVSVEKERIKKLDVQTERDPNHVRNQKEKRLKMFRKTEMYLNLLKREGKPVPKDAMKAFSSGLTKFA